VHQPKLVVITGGPGGGKTALLEVLERDLCDHVAVLPEAASILWKGGFPRRATMPARRSAQRAIVRLQLELQRMTIEEDHTALILCDRGTLDGLAYWPGNPEEYFAETGIDRDVELARYSAVIHLRPPLLEHGYQQTQLRPETASEAAAIDERIAQAWAGHPRHIVIDSDENFLLKLEHAVGVVRAELPPCCAARRTERLAHIRRRDAAFA
jgi:predicted ATPase